ncbi:hypothetical protein GE21DRAFT_1220428, partial [Neurospora crassa]
ATGDLFYALTPCITKRYQPLPSELDLSYYVRWRSFDAMTLFLRCIYVVRHLAKLY